MANDPERPDGQAGDELTPTGQPIYRHKERSIPFQPAVGDSDNIERISAHIERHVGAVSGVYHEILSDLVHIDVHVVNPTPERDCYTLVTSGMSDAPMTVPEGAEPLRHAELLIQLPPEWPLGELNAVAGRKGGEDAAMQAAVERWYWPIRWLKTLARMPHEYDTWLGAGHTVPSGDPPVPSADDTELCCMLVLPPFTLTEEFAELEVNADKVIHFYSLLPLHADEMNLKLNAGTDALLDLFERNRVGAVVNPRRKSVAPRRKLFGLF